MYTFRITDISKCNYSFIHKIHECFFDFIVFVMSQKPIHFQSAAYSDYVQVMECFRSECVMIQAQNRSQSELKSFTNTGL